MSQVENCDSKSSFEQPRFVFPSGDRPTLERAVQRAISFLEDLNTRDVDRLAKWFSQASELWIPPSKARQGDRRILRFFRVVFEQYRDLRWDLDCVYAVSPEVLVTQVTTYGEFRGGASYRNSILTLQRYAPDGTFLLLSDYFKDTAIFGAKEA